jgi:hypothetical protein
MLLRNICLLNEEIKKHHWPFMKKGRPPVGNLPFSFSEKIYLTIGGYEH